MKKDYSELNRWDTIIGRWFSKKVEDESFYLVYAPSDMKKEDIERINSGDDCIYPITQNEEGLIACRLTQIGFRSDAKKIKIFFEIEPFSALANIRKKKFCITFNPLYFEKDSSEFYKKPSDMFTSITDRIENFTYRKTAEFAKENGLQLWFEETHPQIISTLAAKLIFYHNPHLWENNENYY